MIVFEIILGLLVLMGLAKLCGYAVTAVKGIIAQGREMDGPMR